MSVADFKINKFTDPVSTMPDNPSREGMSAKAIKERFDANSEELRVSLNGVIDHITAKDSENSTAFGKKVDKVSGKGLSTNDYTNSEKALVASITGKAEKDNVIEKNSTVAFTPTVSTHPANKGYVDKAINERVKEIGSCDMMQAVYDPQGRKKDIFAETDKKLDLTGGTMTGNITIERSAAPRFSLKQTTLGRTGSIIVSSDGGVYYQDVLDDSNSTALILAPETRTLEETLRMRRIIEGKSSYYKLYGEHNKPSASDVGALSVTGGKLSGGLSIEKSSPELLLKHTDTGRFMLLSVNSDNIMKLSNVTDGSNRTVIMLNDETADINELIKLRKTQAGDTNEYILFGEHNKPSGSYVGNGSSAERYIATGGLNGGNCGAVLIYSENGTVLLTRGYSPGFGSGGTSVFSQDIAGVSSTEGRIFLKTTNTMLNKSGVTYYYRVL